jgi:hypothetical protein
MGFSDALRCNAKSKSTGEQCKAAAVSGKTKCRMHGGKSTGAKTPRYGNKDALKYGIYSAGYTAEEQALLESVSLGKLDDEIKAARILVMRAMRVMREIEEGGTNTLQNQAGFELSEIELASVGDRKRQRTVSKRPDFRAIIDRGLARISSLERARAELLAGGTEDLSARAKAILDAIKSMDAIEEGPAGGTASGNAVNAVNAVDQQRDDSSRDR